MAISRAKGIVMRTKSMTGTHKAASRHAAASSLRQTRRAMKKKFPGALLSRGVSSGNSFWLRYEHP